MQEVGGWHPRPVRGSVSAFADHCVELRSCTMASYPRGKRPRFPFPYFKEVIMGFEYSTTMHLICEGCQ